MLVSLGILAHNEASNIREVIGDIARQSILLKERCSVEMHIVANGCTDATVSISRDALSDHPFQRENVSAFVHTLSRAGKSYAWNELVHNFVSPRTDFVVFLDADIRIPEENTVQLMVDALISNETASISVDRAVKDLSLAVNTTLIEKLILAASGTAHDTRIAISGQLYCARLRDIRDICMPIGLPVEDGFLRAMVLTSSFTEQENLTRLVFVEGAWHIYKSRRHFRDVFRHNARLVIGTVINRLLYEHFREKLINRDIKSYTAERNASDPHWINGLIADEIRKRKYFITHKGFLVERVKWLSKQSILQSFQKAPIVFLATIFDLCVVIFANHLMRKGEGAGYW